MTAHSRTIIPPVAQAIQDAILFGNIKEIDGILDLICYDDHFPDDVRYGLEALMYFRLHYGRYGSGGLLCLPGNKIREMASTMELEWGSELLEKVTTFSSEDAVVCA